MTGFLRSLPFTRSWLTHTLTWNRRKKDTLSYDDATRRIAIRARRWNGTGKRERVQSRGILLGREMIRWWTVPCGPHSCDIVHFIFYRGFFLTVDLCILYFLSVFVFLFWYFLSSCFDIFFFGRHVFFPCIQCSQTTNCRRYFISLSFYIYSITRSVRSPFVLFIHALIYIVFLICVVFPHRALHTLKRYMVDANDPLTRQKKKKQMIIFVCYDISLHQPNKYV